MRTLRETVYRLQPEAEPDDVLATVATRFETRRRTEGPVLETWYDTFDGRLRGSGGVLRTYRRGSETRLAWKAANGSFPRELPADEQPGFARSLPLGPVREEIEPLIEMRRLLPFVETERREVVLDVLDAERKTVARVALEELRSRASGARAWKPAPPVLRAVPLRGYDGAFDELCAFLAEVPGLVADERSRPDRALEAAGIEAPRDPGKLDVPLEPDLRADLGLRRILRALLEVVLRNEEGVRADLDSEFLHDYRVAVRRTRSVLDQVKGVLAPRPLERFRREFKWLADATGPTRDLDVFLLHLDEYERELHDTDLSKLRAHLVRRQRAEHAKLVRALSSQRYRKLIDGWTAFLADESPPPEPAPRHAAKPVLRVFSKRIARLYERMIASEAARAPDAPGSELHRLRLQGKKLRYLLDVSRNLYEPEAVGRAVRELKRLQDVLGDFNDFEVQREQLEAFAGSLAQSGRADAATLLAMGRVIERLRLRGDEARAGFARRFERFASRENRRRYRELFGAGRKSGR